MAGSVRCREESHLVQDEVPLAAAGHLQQLEHALGALGDHGVPAALEAAPEWLTVHLTRKTYSQQLTHIYTTHACDTYDYLIPMTNNVMLGYQGLSALTAFLFSRRSTGIIYVQPLQVYGYFNFFYKCFVIKVAVICTLLKIYTIISLELHI